MDRRTKLGFGRSLKFVPRLTADAGWGRGWLVEGRGRLSQSFTFSARWLTFHQRLWVSWDRDFSPFISKCLISRQQKYLV